MLPAAYNPNAQNPNFLFSNLTLPDLTEIPDSRKALVSPFVCLLICVSLSLSGHKSRSFPFRQLLESLLGIRLETAESNGEKGERAIRINELHRLSASQGKTGEAGARHAEPAPQTEVGVLDGEAARQR